MVIKDFTMPPIDIHARLDHLGKQAGAVEACSR